MPEVRDWFRFELELNSKGMLIYDCIYIYICMYVCMYVCFKYYISVLHDIIMYVMYDLVYIYIYITKSNHILRRAPNNIEPNFEDHFRQDTLVPSDRVADGRQCK